MCHESEHLSDRHLEINKDDLLPPNFILIVMAGNLAWY